MAYKRKRYARRRARRPRYKRRRMTYRRKYRRGARIPGRSGTFYKTRKWKKVSWGKNSLNYCGTLKVELTTPMNTLVSRTIQLPDASGTVGGQGNRWGQSIYCHGIRLWLTFRNCCTAPFECHWALIQPKGFRVTTESEISDDFFRSWDVEDVDGVLSFDSNSTKLEQRYKIFPINPEKFTVFTHKKIWLYPKLDRSFQVGQRQVYDGAGTNTYQILDQHDGQHSPATQWMKQYNMYIPIRKTIQMNGSSDQVSNKPMYLVHWVELLDPADVPVVTGQNIVQSDMFTTIVYTNRVN